MRRELKIVGPFAYCNPQELIPACDLKHTFTQFIKITHIPRVSDMEGIKDRETPNLTVWKNSILQSYICVTS